MKLASRPRLHLGALAILIVGLACGFAHAGSPPAAKAPKAGNTLTFGRFGVVHLYGSATEAAHVVLFVSGDGGWNLGVVDMARTLASAGAFVVGIDIGHYVAQTAAASDECTYAAADFEALSQYVQKSLGRPTYTPPVLVGYSSGATLVYATLVQAPTGTFRGAMSLGFCPDLPLTRPLCRGHGLESEPTAPEKGYRFSPAPELGVPWVALQGEIDQVCAPAATQSFVSQVGNGSVVMLPHVGHGFSVQKNWMPQFRESFGKLTADAGTDTRAAPLPPDITGLPIVELPSRGTPTDVLAVIASGDGGWASLDREVGDYLAGEGVSVVGLNSLQYLWKRKTPDEAGQALTGILRHYSATWKCERFLLIGYSLGADLLPFMASRLPDDLARRVVAVALLGPSPQVDFEFHLTDWLGGGNRRTALPVAPEVAKLAGLRVLCFHGDQEKDSLCPELDASKVTDVALPGAHHFGGDYKSIGKQLLAESRP